jgi:beta-glucosidase
VSADSIPKDGVVTVRFDLKNTGSREGDEVAQLYVKHVGSRVPWPIQELKGFRRVHLAAGAIEQVELPLRAADLGYWDKEKNAFTVEPGTIELRVGSSSADIHLTKTITIAN